MLVLPALRTSGGGQKIPGGPCHFQLNFPSIATEQVRAMEELIVDGETLLTVSSVKVMGGGGGRAIAKEIRE